MADVNVVAARCERAKEEAAAGVGGSALGIGHQNQVGVSERLARRTVEYSACERSGWGGGRVDGFYGIRAGGEAVTVESGTR